jgi:hypothetical protein
MASEVEIAWPTELLPSAGVGLAKQTADVLTALGVNQNGSLTAAWVHGTGSWNWPVPIGGPVLAPGSGIALANQGADVLTAVAIGGDGTLHVAWVNETGNWQGPVPVGNPVLAPGSGIALANQTDEILTCIGVGKTGVAHVAWVEGTRSLRRTRFRSRRRRAFKYFAGSDPNGLPRLEVRHRAEWDRAGRPGRDRPTRNQTQPPT